MKKLLGLFLLFFSLNAWSSIKDDVIYMSVDDNLISTWLENAGYSNIRIEKADKNFDFGSLIFADNKKVNTDIVILRTGLSITLIDNIVSCNISLEKLNKFNQENVALSMNIVVFSDDNDVLLKTALPIKGGISQKNFKFLLASMDMARMMFDNKPEAFCYKK